MYPLRQPGPIKKLVIESGAPLDAQFITLATNATLTAERVLTPGTGLGGSDGGAGSTYTLNLDIDGLTAKTSFSDADEVAIYDSDSPSIKKVTKANLLAGGGFGEWQLLSTTRLTGNAATIEFSSISQDFTNLVLILMMRTDRSAENDGVLLQFNSDTGSTYDRIVANFNSSGLNTYITRATTAINGVAQCEAANSVSNAFAPSVVWIPEYTGANNDKYALGQSTVMGDVSADTDLYLYQCGGRWHGPSGTPEAIDTVTLSPAAGSNFVSGSVAGLYAIM